MGLKRKASYDEPFPLPSSPSSSLSSASHAPFVSTTTTSVDHAYSFWNAGTSPYLHSRTRKRFRDGRPDEETIHQHTLRKLFDAQKQMRPGWNSQGMDQDVSDRLGIQYTPPVQAVFAPEKNQKSLDSFFGVQRPIKHPSPALFQAIHSASMPLVHQPSFVLTCEDCGSPLRTTTTGRLVDVEMADVDHGQFVDPELDEGWSCSMCAKRVCDVCAVHGDTRVCLECALPGGGHHTHGLREKRWVGGIGWL